MTSAAIIAGATMRRVASVASALAALVVAGSGCGQCGSGCLTDETDEGAARAWDRLRTCLAGAAEPTPELMHRIALAAELEDLDDVPQPPPTPSGRMGAAPADERDSRRWPRRCAHHADALARELDDEDRRLANRVTQALEDGTLDEALYELADRLGGGASASASGVTPPPEAASPLAREQVRYVVPGAGCRAAGVVRDASVAPPRHEVHVGCRDGAERLCTLSGEALDAIRCGSARERRDVWSRPAADIGDWTLESRAQDGRCTYVARRTTVTELGERECGRGATWTRPCRAGTLLGVAFVHPPREGLSASTLALSEGDGFELVDAPVYADGGVLVSCDDEAMRLHRVTSRTEFVDDAMRAGMIRPPSRRILTVEAHRCTPSGCTKSSAELAAHGTREGVAPLGDDVVLLQVLSRGEDHQGVVAHVAPLDELGEAPPRWVLDPSDGIQIEWLGPIQWATAPAAAVAFVADEERGMIGIRFDAEGTVSYLAP